MTFSTNPSIWVGGLDPSVNEQKLYDHFVRIGAVASVRVCVDSITQKSLGYGYVNFQNPQDAEKALDEAGVKLGNKHIRIAAIQRDPTKRRTGATNVVVKKLPASVDTYALKDMFSKFGRLTAIGLATNENGESRGYARISFEKEDATAEAVKEMNEMEIDGQSILVERYQPQYREQQLQKFTNLYVKNIDLSVTDEQFAEYFSQFGNVTSSKVSSAGDDANAGFGYVDFADHEAAAKVVEEVNDKEVSISKEGTKLELSRFRSREERQRDRESERRNKQQQFSKYPNLYVKGFDEAVTTERLKELFERFGETVSVHVMADKDTHVSKCFGFVSMKDQTAASRAIQELHGSTILSSCPLFVTYALRKDARQKTIEEQNKQYRMRQPPPAGMMNPPMNFVGAQNMFNNVPFVNPRMTMMQNTGMGAAGRPFAPNPMTQMRSRPAQKPMVPQMPQAPQMQQMPQLAQSQNLHAMLSTMSPEQQKNILGERLYAYIHQKHPSYAAKVTGMLLEMDNAEIVGMLEQQNILDAKINEALDVLSRHAGL